MIAALYLPSTTVNDGNICRFPQLPALKFQSDTVALVVAKLLFERCKGALAARCKFGDCAAEIVLGTDFNYPRAKFVRKKVQQSGGTRTVGIVSEEPLHNPVAIRKHGPNGIDRAT